MDILEQQRQLYLDIKDVFGTKAGERVLAWWRRQARHGHAVLIPGDSHATHFYLGRQAEIDTVMEVLRTDIGELVCALQERLDQQQQGRPPADPMWGPGAADDWLYPEKRSADGQDKQ